MKLLALLVQREAGVTPAMVVALTIRADRYEPLQLAPQLADLETVLFDDLKPMPPAGCAEVITGPARRATAAGRRLHVLEFRGEVAGPRIHCADPTRRTLADQF